MKNNYIEYNELHWSKIKSPQKALDKYLNNYKDIYNLMNNYSIQKAREKGILVLLSKTGEDDKKT